jgi:carbon monoxide dehydrogenase subunit G
MPAVVSEIEIAAPQEAVWEVVMDPHRLGDWVTTHHALGDGAPRELSAGSTFKQTLKLGGARFEVEWTVVECDRPRRVAWDGDGPKGSSAKVRYGLEPAGGGTGGGERGEATTFSYENEFELPGGALGRLAGRTVGAATAKREAERSLANLKRLIE